MQGWVGWSGMLVEKEGSLCGSVCGLYGEIKDVYECALMKVCFPTVFTPLGPAGYLTEERRVMEEKAGRRVRVKGGNQVIFFILLQ